MSQHKHYGPDVMRWLRDVIDGKHVPPLVLVGPPCSGKSSLFESLACYVSATDGDDCVDGPWNARLVGHRVVRLQERPLPRWFDADRITLHDKMKPPVRAANNIAWLLERNEEPHDLPAGCLVVRLREIPLHGRMHAVDVVRELLSGR